jgi:hypothetical protein
MPQEIDEVERRIMQLEIERTALKKEKIARRSSAARSWSGSSPSCARNRRR